MAKLTDKQRKKIIAERVYGATIRTLAAKYEVSPSTIRKTLKSDPTLTQKCARKKEENTASVLAFMDSKKNDVCTLIENLLAAMNDPNKIAVTPLSQLATTMGIVIDKYTANESIKSSDARENNLFEAMDAWEEDDFSDLPEIQQASNADVEMVENERAQEKRWYYL